MLANMILDGSFNCFINALLSYNNFIKLTQRIARVPVNEASHCLISSFEGLCFHDDSAQVE
jgi:hypothetical protein